MTFNPNIPQADERPSQSQNDLLANFTALNTVFAVDHLAFNAVNAGEHTQVTLTAALGANPTPPGNAYPKAGIYSNTLTIGGVDFSELFYESTRSVGVNILRQLTGIEIVNPGAGGATDYGLTTPWGIVFNWGVAVCATFVRNVTFAVPHSTIPIIVVSPYANNAANNHAVVDDAAAPTVNGFRARSNQTTGTIYYLSIG